MKGICFIEPLFNKVVAGQKTQTRRMIKSSTGFFNVESTKDGVIQDIWKCDADGSNGDDLIPVKPKYKLGETVYLKEPYSYLSLNNQEPVLIYKYGEDYSDVEELSPIKWSNKLFMPQSAARHFIKITGVRAERLQDISNVDCLKEGIQEARIIRCDYGWYENGLTINGQLNGQIGWPTPQEAYSVLIDKINGKGTWDSNPWVWVYDFEESYGF
jgi:hypothetical protein